MKKRKRPKLVVDNKLPDEHVPEKLTRDEMRYYIEQLNDLHERYPEIEALKDRALATKDMAMEMAIYNLIEHYYIWRDVVAEDRRNELQVADRES